MSRKDPNQGTRGKRAKSLRMMTGLSRELFALRTGIPPSSQQNWESPSANGLTESGAQRIIRGCAPLGVHASFEWLMHGHGSSPVIDSAVFEGDAIPRQPTTSVNADDQSLFIQQELALFRQHYKEAVDLIVPDRSMEPRFAKGTCVAGTRLYKDDIAQAINHDCIVLTKDGKVLLRHVKASDIHGHYTLVCSNHLSSAGNQHLPDIQLVSAAPVLWVRMT